MAKEFPTQRVTLVGVMKKYEAKEFTAETTGVNYKSYNFQIEEKDSKVLIFADKLRKLDGESDKSKEFYDKIEADFPSMVDTTVKIVIYPSKDKTTKEVKQYNYLHTEELSDGGKLIKLSGGIPNKLSDEDIDNDLSTSISVSMMVEDIDGLRIGTTNGAEGNKEKLLDVYFDKANAEFVDRIDRGHGYTFKLALEKGKMEEVEDGVFDFDGSAKTFSPNKLVIKSITANKNLVGLDYDDDKASEDLF